MVTKKHRTTSSEKTRVVTRTKTKEKEREKKQKARKNLLLMTGTS